MKYIYDKDADNERILGDSIKSPNNERESAAKHVSINKRYICHCIDLVFTCTYTSVL